MIKLLILGPTGSMGKLISTLAMKDSEISVVAACDVNHIGDELGFLIGASDPNKVKIENINKLQEVIVEKQPEVAIDFTTAEATEKNCLICVENGVRCVIGTTALSEDLLKKFEELVKRNKAPAVISPNMATGVNVLFKMASILTKYLNDWDIEVLETHHNRKIDVPSGTALKIGKIISETLDSDFEKIAKIGRNRGFNKRLAGARNEIGIHSIRAGDIIGDHLILYSGPGERIELKHQAHSRECFANGAIEAIKFIIRQQENRIYTMNDVLDL
ncbi:MAG: 4-hydroxy-tetrahydrodipicolinate reductase [Candidatus Thorarchaeota archaeon]